MKVPKVIYVSDSVGHNGEFGWWYADPAEWRYKYVLVPAPKPSKRGGRKKAGKK